jgi:hypothetical protein
MKNLKINIIAALIILATSLTSLTGMFISFKLLIWKVCELNTYGSFSSGLSESIDEQRIIATYKDVNYPEKPQLLLERMKRWIKYKWLFISDISYTKEYYINSIISQKIIAKSAQKSIVLSQNFGVKPLNYIPDTILVIDNNNNVTGTYIVDTVFQYNVENIPTVPLYKRLTIGPWSADEPDCE